MVINIACVYIVQTIAYYKIILLVIIIHKWMKKNCFMIQVFKTENLGFH